MESPDELRARSRALRAASRESLARGRNARWVLTLKKALRAKRAAGALGGTVHRRDESVAAYSRRREA